MSFIYFDNNSTSALDPRVLEEMLPYLKECYGNPSSGHAAGRTAKQALELARLRVATLINASPEEIFFTGGASEANNLCIKGSVLAAWQNGLRNLELVSSNVEHASVKKSMQFLSDYFGVTIVTLPVDAQCALNLTAAETALCAKPFLISCMAAQNEVGTLQPLSALNKLIKRHSPDTLFHVDASQAAGKIPLDVKALGVDMMVLAAQKFHGPKGVGAAFVRKGLKLESLVHGVGHEGGRRAGTENVSGIVGLGMACAIAKSEMEQNQKKLLTLRQALWDGIRSIFPNVTLNTPLNNSLPNTLNVCLPQADSTQLLAKLSDIFGASTGAACHWGVSEPSEVLLSMGVPKDVARGAIRFSLSKMNSTEEIAALLKTLKDAAQ